MSHPSLSHPFHAHADAPAVSVSCPFIVEHVLPGDGVPGNFVPAARLLVTPALRTSGLLAQLPDAEAKSLLLLLTFLSPNGRLRASLDEVAEALRTSPDKSRRRVQRLAETRWQASRWPRAVQRTAAWRRTGFHPGSWRSGKRPCRPPPSRSTRRRVGRR